METKKLTKRACLLLAIVHLSGASLNGATRLQKMALLASKDLDNLKTSIQTFTDWVPGDYGGRSVQVYRAISELVKKDMLEERECSAMQ